eukprot:jgi/Ulvmu1/6930/UM032_0008.1
MVGKKIEHTPASPRPRAAALMWTPVLAALACVASTVRTAAAIDTPSPPWSPNYPGYCIDSPTENEPCPDSGYFLLSDLACINNGFGGCPGSVHRFDTLEECEQTCVGLSLPVCEQPIIKGLGKGSFPRWGVNFFTGQCEFFILGGGGGNDNAFETEAECLRACPRPTGPAPVCSLPFVKGPCKALGFPWGFDGVSCVQFEYGGCMGNGNRFDSKAECEAACGHSTPVDVIKPRPRPTICREEPCP